MLDRAGHRAVPRANRQSLKPANSILLKKPAHFCEPNRRLALKDPSSGGTGGSNHYTEGYYDYAR